jgi:uncharacterized protein with PQ loop repeat
MENQMSAAFEWIGFAAISLSILAYLPQIIHMIRLHCSAGLSMRAYSMWMVSSVLLLAYSIAKIDLVFILLQTYQATAGALVLYYGLKYRGLSFADGGVAARTTQPGEHITDVPPAMYAECCFDPTVCEG